MLSVGASKPVHDSSTQVCVSQVLAPMPLLQLAMLLQSSRSIGIGVSGVTTTS